MNATKLKEVKPVSEELQEIKHILKILTKGQEAIKSHLYREEKQPKKPDNNKQRELTKEEAINYINNVFMPELEAHQAERGEIGAQGLTDWFIAQLAQPLINWLKTQALQYIGEALTELKRKAIPYAVEAADWAIDQLENIIVEQYKKADKEDKQAFKDAIKEKFPDSRLLGKL